MQLNYSLIVQYEVGMFSNLSIRESITWISQKDSQAYANFIATTCFN